MCTTEINRKLFKPETFTCFSSGVIIVFMPNHQCKQWILDVFYICSSFQIRTVPNVARSNETFVHTNGYIHEFVWYYTMKLYWILNSKVYFAVCYIHAKFESHSRKIGTALKFCVNVANGVNLQVYFYFFYLKRNNCSMNIILGHMSRVNLCPMLVKQWRVKRELN